MSKIKKSEIKELIENHSLSDKKLAKLLGIKKSQINLEPILKLIRDKGYAYWCKPSLTSANKGGWIDENKLNDREKEVLIYLQNLV